MEKVLVTTTTFPRWKNDTTPKFVYDLSRRLASRYKVIVLAPHHKGAKKREIMDTLDVRRFAYFKPEWLQKLCYGGGIIPNMKRSFLAKIQMPLLILSEFIASCRIIKKEQINMIHAHWILPQGFIGAFLKKLFRIPLLVTIHGSDLFPLKSIFFKKLQNFVVKNSNYITVNSDASKKELVKRFPPAAFKVVTIPMGVDLNLFRKRKSQKPKKYSKNKILLFVGRLSDQKGLQYLVDSIPKLARLYPNIKLLIIGEGPYEETLRKKVHENRVEANVEFLGSVPNYKLLEYHNFADIFILPSLSNRTGTEALGLSLLEAMASGCAVIGTKVGGIPFVVRNGYNGILVREKNPHELSNAIITLLKNRKKAEKLGKNAAEFTRKNYSWDRVSKDFLRTYNKLLK